MSGEGVAQYGFVREDRLLVASCINMDFGLCDGYAAWRCALVEEVSQNEWSVDGGRVMCTGSSRAREAREDSAEGSGAEKLKVDVPESLAAVIAACTS